MIFADDRDGERRRGSADAAESAINYRGRPKDRKRRSPTELGHALKNAYQRTIEEDIPPEMLDLLGKLG